MSAQLDVPIGVKARNASLVINPGKAWWETCTFTLIAIATCLWADPSNTQFSNAYFAWFVLVPIVPGLRYGFYHGALSAVGCALMLTGTWLVHHHEISQFPTSEVLGLLAAGMLTGEFVEMWHRRIYHLEAVCQSQQARFEEFARSYHLLRMSHTRLEQKTFGHSASLRNILFQLRKQLQDFVPSDPHEARKAADAILDVFRKLGYLQTAALYWIDASDRLVTPAISCLGKPPTLTIQSPLVIDALQKGCVTAIDREQRLDAHGLLAVIPLDDITRRVWGIVAIYEIPYFALKNKVFDSLAILGGHIGDILMQKGAYGEVVSVSLPSLYSAIERSLTDLKYGRLPAGVIRIVIRSRDLAEDIGEILGSASRCIDKRWIFHVGESEFVILVLLSMTDASGGDQFALRIEQALARRMGADRVAEFVVFSVQQLTKFDQPDRLIDHLATNTGWPGPQLVASH